MMMACALMAGTARAANDAARWNRCRCRRLRTGRDTATLPWRRKEHRISSDGASLTDAAAGVVRGSAPVQSSAAPWAMACRGSKRVMMAADEGHHNAMPTLVCRPMPLETARQTTQPCIRVRRTSRTQAKDSFSAAASLFKVGWRASCCLCGVLECNAWHTASAFHCLPHCTQQQQQQQQRMLHARSKRGRLHSRRSMCHHCTTRPSCLLAPRRQRLAVVAFPVPLQQCNSGVRAQTHSQPCR